MKEPSGISPPQGQASANLRHVALVRARDWWDSKLVPIFAGYYATALFLGTPLAGQWATLLTLLLVLANGAAYVSLVNDLTDLDSDRRAGKPNRMERVPPAWRTPIVAAPVVIGLAAAYAWRDDPLLVGCYTASWIAFSFYSLAPIRLKARGFLGVLADASGAHLFPTLTAALLAFRHAGVEPDPVWLAAIAAWAFGYGLRGILWHQLFDVAADEAAGVRTFAQRRPELARGVGRWLVFPLELAGLAYLLARLETPLPWLALAFYLGLVALRLRLWAMRAIIVQPVPRYLILLHEYYDVFLPIALLAAAALRAPQDGLVLVAHLLLFGGRPLQTGRDLRDLFYRPVVRRLRARLG